MYPRVNRWILIHPIRSKLEPRITNNILRALFRIPRHGDVPNFAVVSDQFMTLDVQFSLTGSGSRFTNLYHPLVCSRHAECSDCSMLQVAHGSVPAPSSSSHFSELVSRSTFVDKTLLIMEVLALNRTAVISAPAGQGKTASLDMLQAFFTIEVDNEGRQLTRVNYLTDPVTDTPNYRLFVDQQLKIVEQRELFSACFGKVPVLRVRLGVPPHYASHVRSMDDAVTLYRLAVHNTYKEYSYLKDSGQLREDERIYIETWIDDEQYKMFGKQRVTCALRELSEYLFKHFHEQRVLVLVDDYDSVLASAMLNVKDDDELDDIVRLCFCLLNAVLRSNTRHMSLGVMAGRMPLPEIGSPPHDTEDRDSYHQFRFLGDHRLQDFFGLTRNEVKELLTYPKLKLGENIGEEVKAKYNGYTSSSGKPIYNLYSTLNFLKEGKIDNYWLKLNPITHFSEVLRHSPEISQFIIQLLKGKSIKILVPQLWTVTTIVKLRHFLLDPDTHSTKSCHTFLSYLLELGYLTCVQQANGQSNENNVAIQSDFEEVEEIEQSEEVNAEELENEYGENQQNEFRRGKTKQVDRSEQSEKPCHVKIPNDEIKEAIGAISD